MHSIYILTTDILSYIPIFIHELELTHIHSASGTYSKNLSQSLMPFSSQTPDCDRCTFLYGK